MLNRIGRIAVRRCRLVLLGVVLVTALFGAVGGGVVEDLSAGGFEDPKSESSRASAELSDRFGIGSPNMVLLVRAGEQTGERVDSAAAETAGRRLTDRLRKEHGITQVVSYWTAGKPKALLAEDGTAALVVARVKGDVDAATDRLEELRPQYAGKVDGFDIKLGGSLAVGHETGKTVEKDLQKAEAFAFPVLLVLLVLIFGSVVAALLPLLVTLPVVFGTLFTLRMFSLATDVSVFALNVATVVGLGLAVDYSLFLLSRYKEELRARGADINDREQRGEAIRAAVRSAGRTVLFSAVTVSLSMAALALFPLYFLRSLAYAGIAVPLLAAMVTLFLVPAMLSLLGPRIDRWNLRTGLRRLLRRPERGPRAADEGMWHRLALFVMRFPVPVATAAVLLLLALGLPFLGAKFGLPDDRVMPPASQSREVGDAVREEFSSRESDALSVVAKDVGDTGAQATVILDYSERLSDLDGVATVTSMSGIFADGKMVAPAGPYTAQQASADSTWIKVVPDVEPYSDAGTELVAKIRELDSPWPIKVSGPSAALVDTNRSLADRLPWALAFIGVTSFVLLFLFTGSVLLPLKAIVLNLLSMCATFGAMVWIFQEGHLSGWFGDFTVTGALVTTAPVLMFCAAFGMSMDYEVFMLSRIKEEYERTGDTRGAVAAGLAQVGGLITAAAALLAVVCFALVMSSVSFAKMIGLGLTLAIIVDATVVRGLLVPAFMRIAGRFNWWAPAPLRKLHARFGVREEAAGAGHPRTATTDGEDHEMVTTGGRAS
ncbi:MMPL family transporter [Streptomyces xantholiticus]|uniref:MMPL family transporter n=1 Tax=Streptomyces xantholiticus TaxID=68285 RepID=UPI00167BA48B|nr:MMPL family transporter [Streptomyces xantholiticus]GGW64157.1 membrane protein [Streptomyces xantholiticus]